MARSLKHRILGVSAVVVAGPLLFAGAWGRALLYHPTHSDAERLATGGWEAERVQVTPDIEVQGLIRRADDPQAPWLIMFGGNAMSLEGSRWALDKVAGANRWGLAAFAYRGYDGSEGSPTQAALTADAVSVVKHLQSAHGVPPDRLVIVGQSLGSGIAAHVAAVLARAGTPPRGVALVSPYTSMSEVFNDQVPVFPVGWVTPDTYRTIDLADELAAPVLLVHGDKDTLISVDHSRRLSRSLGDKATLIELDGRGHGDVWDDPRTVSSIRNIVVGVP